MKVEALPRVSTKHGSHKMRAVIFEKPGSMDELKYTYVDTPKPGPGEVLIKIHACALNHLDLWTLKGMPGAKITLPHILGCDIAGEVVGYGPKTKKIKGPVIAAPGISCGKCTHCKSGWDSLCDKYKILGFQINGGYAEFAVVPEVNVIRVSKVLTLEQWAAFPLVATTAWHMLATRADLKKGETVLIHSAGSGVGSMAIQIAKYLGAKVITTVGSDEKIKKAKSIGADHVIQYEKKSFAEEVLALTSGRGVDVVVEHIGAGTFQKSLACLAKKGRLVTCGVTTGSLTQVDLRFIFARQLSIIGCYMGGIHELEKVVRLVDKKFIKPVIHKTFTLREARQALECMQDRANFGKIVLTP